jgi:UDP-4-amino-4,6-dideoxy-N-acetyl-beta-L-altrosamine N-acetyltransferase
MKITKYGVTLTRLTENKIEMIRIWRNDPKISKYMEYRETITPEMQLKWFNKINNDKNYYFIIVYQGQEIGLINVRDINYEEGEGEAGIYIYNDEYLNTPISFQASFCLCDFCFDTLKLNRLIAHILKDNKRAIKFNKMIGYKISTNQENINNQLYILTCNDYLIVRDEIAKIFL